MVAETRRRFSNSARLCDAWIVGLSAVFRFEMLGNS